eukprot:Nitzschia sp. Nitz4//scaffold11_size288233//211357//214878//NITZ4_000801-RA/size288233-processed-gene-0.182-mRNA-1//1//CDS//3329534155//6661//frame0
MVVSEVPLWVVHSTVSSTGGTTGAVESAVSGHLEVTGNGTSDAASSPSQQRAAESLTLLEGLGGTHKCAIYGMDIHPDGHIFATGGGDGTVRVWNAAALFRVSPKSSYSEAGAYESSGESSQDSYTHNGRSNDVSGIMSMSHSALPTDPGTADPDQSPNEEVVHDLTSVVRRKKDSTTPQKGTTPSGSNGQSKTPTHSTPHHHAHHHRHRLLATLSAHTGSSVLALRFSPSGKFLASAGDDAAVCIYAPATSLAAQGNLENSEHQWTRIKLCRGHALDVVGLAWAPDDSHLVSCSLDSNAPIIVWKLTDLASNHTLPTHSNVLLHPYKILGRGIHTSMVKGVTFDPAGSYLATSGDDPSVCIWRAHDDWGLERRIDAKSGIFRQWSDNNSQSLSSQSLFRRLSWSTDGAYICATNAVVKNKNVASTISREGWAVSSANSTASGAANLVGHKQPVVACRHCPFLLDNQPEGSESTSDEPSYATLLALGDKRGFITVWSTKQSRPVFKLQCSETRCTVTDLAWGKVQGDVCLLVSLLDGQVVALRFGVPDELGKLLKADEKALVFQRRYGIELNDSAMGSRRLFVGENAAPKFIENALQYALEDQDDDEDEEEDTNDSGKKDMDVDAADSLRRTLSPTDVKASQSESRTKGGKKRIQPMLMSVDAPPPKKAKADSDKPAKKKVDTLEGALELAEKAATGAEAAVASQKATAVVEATVESNAPEPRETSAGHAASHHHHVVHQLVGGQVASPQIPHSTDRVHSVDLPVAEGSGTASEPTTKFVADCTNSIQVPPGSRGSGIPCATLSISRSGVSMWKDQILGSSCSALAACKTLLAVGTTDGSVQLFGTSPSVGWSGGVAFRSHPPFVWSRPIVALQFHETEEETTLLVVAADATFGVYTVSPRLERRYKGSIMPPMSHMFLSANLSTSEIQLPRLVRIQVTESNRLLLVLSSHVTHTRGNTEDTVGGMTSSGAGGSLQAFVYDRLSELWMRVADSRFVLSDFYKSLPTLSKRPVSGELTKLDDLVRLGATSSSMQPSRRGRVMESQAGNAYQMVGASESFTITRSHCEDRMACAVALHSAPELEYWLTLYARTLAMNGDEEALRILVDILRGLPQEDGKSRTNSGCWWLADVPSVLSLDRTKLIKSKVIPEMSKNRSLQRLTNEIAMEMDLERGE